MDKRYGPSLLTIIAIAAVCHDANRRLCIEQGDTSQVPWDNAPEWVRTSAAKGVQEIIDNPSITPEQLHERWSAHKRAEGWVYGAVKDAELKTHHCLVPYAELSAAQQAKDALFHAVARALLFHPDASALGEVRTPATVGG